MHRRFSKRTAQLRTSKDCCQSSSKFVSVAAYYEVTFQHILLVGGFASSDYLYNRLQALLEPSGFRVVRPENHV